MLFNGILLCTVFALAFKSFFSLYEQLVHKDPALLA